MHKKVRFKGKEYWLHESNHCDGLISPLEHFSESGKLLADGLSDISYAIIEEDDIIRFQEVIGKVSELEEVNAQDNTSSQAEET